MKAALFHLRAHAFTAHEIALADRLATKHLGGEPYTSVLGTPTRASESVRKCVVKWLGPGDGGAPLYEAVRFTAMFANEACWDFVISDFTGPLQFTDYEGAGAHYDWHTDWGPGVGALRKLSVTIQLSEPEDYVGGDLELMDMDVPPAARAAMRSRGAAVVFPSFIQHRVTPIVSGRRKSLVAWLGGSAFR